jgi:tRNA modification GTPase
MTRSYLDPPCPIVAVATAQGAAALAVLRMAGSGSIGLASRCFSKSDRLENASGYSMVLGYLVDPENGERIDEVIASVFRAPRSQTGEDGVEFSCHGSPEVLRRGLQALEKAGFAPALPGEFSLRALLNGKTDLLRAEAVEELVHSRGEKARAEALSRLEGGLSERVGAIRAALVDLLAETESRLDYPEDEGPEGHGPATPAIRNLQREVEKLSASYSIGRLHREGARVVIAGQPNAGKSSLFNLLLREERSIVSAEPGTTRDWIESWIELEGLPIRLTDTAGIREGASSVETAGVARALELSGRADAILYLVDGLRGSDSTDEAFLRDHPAAIRVFSKTDDPGCLSVPAGYLAMSALSGEGLSELAATLAASLRGSYPDASETGVVVAGERQKILLDRTAQALGAALEDADGGRSLDILALDLKEAAFHLGEMTGEILSGEILESVFSRFCLGK